MKGKGFSGIDDFIIEINNSENNQTQQSSEENICSPAVQADADNDKLDPQEQSDNVGSKSSTAENIIISNNDFSQQDTTPEATAAEPESDYTSSNDKLHSLIREHKRGLRWCIVGIVCFVAFWYVYYGPSDFHVDRLAKEGNGTEMLQMVKDYSRSNGNENVSKRATWYFAGQPECKEYYEVCNLLNDSIVSYKHKAAIIQAATERTALIANFYVIFEANENIRELLAENAKAHNKNFFKTKLLNDANELLVTAKNHKTIQPDKLRNLNIYNIDNITTDEALSDFNLVIKTYQLSWRLANNDIGNLKSAFNEISLFNQSKYFKNHENAFNLIKEKILKVDELSQSKDSLTKQLSNKGDDLTVKTARNQVNWARSQLNKLDHINYYPLNYLDDNSVLAEMGYIGGPWIVVQNVRNDLILSDYVYYHDYVSRHGTTKVTANDTGITYDVPVFESEDENEYYAVINKNQAILNRFENEVAQLKYDLAQNVHQQEVLINEIKGVLQPILVENNGRTAEMMLSIDGAKDL